MGLFDIFKKKPAQQVSAAQPGQPQAQQPSKDEVQQEFIAAATANAERFVQSAAGRSGNQLDYSEQSLEILDELLGEVAAFRNEMDAALISDLTAQAGSYIFEVARRTYGGTYFWYDALDQPILVTGLPDFEISLVAIDKVRMRIENGDAENIPFFFQGYADRVKQAKPGDKSMVV
jgi:hypothetical protein